MNHATKTLSNKKQQDWSHFGGIEGVGHYRQGQTSQTKVNHLGCYSHSLSLSIGCTVTVSYLFPVLLVSHKGPSKKELGQAPINIFDH